MSDPIIHHGPWETWEYRLPVAAKDFGKKELSVLTPWFTRYFNKSSEEVRELLADDWSQVCPGVAIRLRDLLLSEFVPTSVAIDQTEHEPPKPWLVLNTEDQRTTAVMLREPNWVSGDDEASLKSFGDDSLADLATHFFMAICEPLCVSPTFDFLAIGAIPVTKEELIMRPWTEQEEERYGEWVGSIPVYGIASGDTLYLRPDGKLGVWFHEYAWSSGGPGAEGEGGVVIFESLEEFIEPFMAHLRGDESQRDFPFRS